MFYPRKVPMSDSITLESIMPKQIIEVEMSKRTKKTYREHVLAVLNTVDRALSTRSIYDACIADGMVHKGTHTTALRKIREVLKVYGVYMNVGGETLWSLKEKLISKQPPKLDATKLLSDELPTINHIGYGTIEKSPVKKKPRGVLRSKQQTPEPPKIKIAKPTPQPEPPTPKLNPEVKSTENSLELTEHELLTNDMRAVVEMTKHMLNVDGLPPGTDIKKLKDELKSIQLGIKMRSDESFNVDLFLNALNGEFPESWNGYRSVAEKAAKHYAGLPKGVKQLCVMFSQLN